MHIAFAEAAVPVARPTCRPTSIAHERTIAAARAAESGKPADIVAKMVEGGVNKFLAEITLLGQPFVKDDKPRSRRCSTAKKAQAARLPLPVVGEGIEKKRTTSPPKWRR